MTDQDGDRGGLDAHDEEILAFWRRAESAVERGRVPVVTGPVVFDTVPPPAWSFGADNDQADELLALLLEGRKTATASALWDYQAEAEPLPEPGELSIILDGSGRPRALVAITDVRTVPFAEVDADHAAAEGEGDGSLTYWRAVHERFFTDHAAHDRGFSPEMPVVLETFTVLYQE
jgi:uncharacterized protein YhfF